MSCVAEPSWIATNTSPQSGAGCPSPMMAQLVESYSKTSLFTSASLIAHRSASNIFLCPHHVFEHLRCPLDVDPQTSRDRHEHMVGFDHRTGVDDQGCPREGRRAHNQPLQETRPPHAGNSLRLALAHASEERNNRLAVVQAIEK